MQLVNAGLEIGHVANLGIRGASEAIAKSLFPWGEPMPCEAPTIGQAILVQATGHYPVYVWPSRDPAFFHTFGLDSEVSVLWASKRPHALGSRSLLHRVGYEGRYNGRKCLSRGRRRRRTTASRYDRLRDLGSRLEPNADLRAAKL
jgi:hypothetical protein